MNLDRLRLGRDALCSLGATGVATAAGAVSGVIIARAMGPSDRGLFASLTVVPFLVMAIGSLGLDDAMARAVGNAELRAAGAARLAWVWGSAWGLLVALVLWPVQALLVLDGRSMLEATLIVGLAPAFIVTRLINGIVLGSGSFLTWNALRTLGGLVFTTAIGIMVVTTGLSSREATWAWVCAYGVCVLSAVVVTRRWGVPDRTSNGVAVLKSLVSFGAKVGATRTAAQVGQRIDQVVLAAAVPMHDLGLYAVASTVALTPGGLVMSYAGYTFGRCSRMSAERRVAAAAALARRGWLLSLALYGLAWMATPFILEVGFGPEYAPATAVTRWLCAGAFLYSGCSVSVAVLNAADRAHHATTAQVASVVLAAALLPIAVWRGGAAGAAYVTVAANMLNAYLVTRALRRLTAAPAGNRVGERPETATAGSEAHVRPYTPTSAR